MHVPRPFGVSNIYGDPGLVAPDSGGSGSESLDGFRLREGSLCIGSGMIVSNNGGRDFFGNPVPSDSAPDIGGYQHR